MLKISVINGPNLNMLGRRNPKFYGGDTLDDINMEIAANFPNVEFSFFQSNCEGKIIDEIQRISMDSGYAGIIINPGAYAHYSYAIADALRDCPLPKIEVHLSDISSRESWRQVSVTSDAADLTIMGKGKSGYSEAAELILRMINSDHSSETQYKL